MTLCPLALTTENPNAECYKYGKGSDQYRNNLHGTKILFSVFQERKKEGTTQQLPSKTLIWMNIGKAFHNLTTEKV